jgi:hypothetical protein
MRNRVYEHTIGEGNHDYISFTQVCQQIRAEYRPIFLRHHSTFYMDHQRFDFWLHTFHPGWNDPNMNKASITAHMCIHDIGHWLSDGFSFLPLLRLCTEAPDFQIRPEAMYWDYDWQYEGEHIGRMLQCRDA